MRADERPAWVLFDGHCGLCDGLVRWLVRRDRRRRLRFGTLQGRTADAVRSRRPELAAIDETIVLVEAPETPRERVRVRSDAVLALLVRLGGVWVCAGVLRAFPTVLRDLLYAWVARRRRRWFGTLERCRTPTEEERRQFLG